jgi:signal transduction histidine kinase
MIDTGSVFLRLITAAAITIAVTLGVAGWALDRTFSHHIEKTIAQDLQLKMTELSSVFDVVDGAAVLTADLSDPRYAKPYGGAYWRVVENGAPIMRSRSLWDGELKEAVEVSTPSPQPAVLGQPRDVVGPDNSEVYLLERVVSFGEDQRRNFTLGVAIDHSAATALQQSFRKDVLQALLLIGTVLLLGSWLQMKYGLLPLRKLRSKLEAVRVGASPRLMGRFPQEVAPLAEDLNLLISRQEETLTRARKHAGDLAHGLKTPLTILSAEARKLESVGEHEQAAVMREQISAMQAHVERELARARVHGVSRAAGTLCDASQSIDRIFRLMARMPGGADLVFDNQLSDDLRLRMDADDFGELAGNLIDNARKHAAKRIEVSAVNQNGRFTICFDDDGPGLSAAISQRLIQRGERGDERKEGSGLGLSIATDILETYGTSLSYGTAPIGGCRASFIIAGTTSPPPAE